MKVSAFGVLELCGGVDWTLQMDDLLSELIYRDATSHDLGRSHFF